MKIGIMACGGIAHTMARTLTAMIGRGDNVEKYAVASRDIKKAEAFAKEHDFKKAYGTYDELVEDKEVELIYIASVHSNHYEDIKRCLDNGKHVLCEKAFTTDANQARELFELAQNKGLLLTEAMWVKYMPLVNTLREVLASKVIGNITTVTANLHYSIDMNQRIVDPALAGGALLDVGVYTISFATICMGFDIASVNAVCTKFDTGVDKQNNVTIIYNDGRMAVCNSGTQAISDRKGIIYGRKGYIIVENINNPESISVYDNEHNRIEYHEAKAQLTGYEYEVLASIDAINKGLTECPECPHDESVKIMEIMDKAREEMGIRYPFE